MAERLTEVRRQKVAGIWEAQHQHPFVRGIGDGTLGLERFEFWLRQDYVFPIEYARLLALAAARSPDLETMVRFAMLVKETLETEISLHRAYAAEFGIGHEELEKESSASTTRAYTDFLLRVAAMGDFAELVAALLPCMWRFSEIGQRLATHPPPAKNVMPSGSPCTAQGNLPNWRDVVATCSTVSPQVCPSVTYRNWKQRFPPAAAMNGSSGRWLGKRSAGRYDRCASFCQFSRRESTGIVNIPRVLIIAGSDSGSGAGIQADLKTVSALGAFGMTAITALTAQSTTGVYAIVEIEPNLWSGRSKHAPATSAATR